MRLSNDFIELESFVTKLIIFGLSLLLIFCTCHFLAYWMVIFWFLCEFFWGMCLHFTELVQYTFMNNGLLLANISFKLSRNVYLGDRLIGFL